MYYSFSLLKIKLNNYIFFSSNVNTLKIHEFNKEVDIIKLIYLLNNKKNIINSQLLKLFILKLFILILSIKSIKHLKHSCSL